ncbi:MAG: polysaccharide pyruvyl transferase family protein [Verrucomicrobia bacterium]|nr:polysaccharide pyruvyl transferase family protein [Verrucomicrobiota bacterium]
MISGSGPATRPKYQSNDNSTRPPMRIAYFLNTAHSINWGGQATSSGLQLLVEKNYPQAEFVPLDVPKLPYKHLPCLHYYWNRKLALAILDDDFIKIEAYLQRLHVAPALSNGFDTVCFNGEGAIHARSGHLIRLMGMLYCFKHKGSFVSALNQTVDLGHDALARKVVAKVYRMVDYVAAREPVSLRELASLGINAQLQPDAAYALPRLTQEQIDRHTENLGLPERFIGVTGSSALGKTSTSMMDFLLVLIREHYGLPIVFLANAKTDIYLAEALRKKHGFMVIKPPVKYEQAMAVVARAERIIGGRQHPNIFAAMYHVPFIPFCGNTHKMQGVVELLGYPLEVLSYRKDKEAITAAFRKADSIYEDLRKIEPPHLKHIYLG